MFNEYAGNMEAVADELDTVRDQMVDDSGLMRDKAKGLK